MYRTDYQNQLDANRHQQKMWQYARNYRLAEIAQPPRQRAWLNLLAYMLSIFTR